MAVQCLHPRIDAGAAAGSPTFPFFDGGSGFHGASTASSPCVDDGAGVDTVRALQHLQSRLARLDRERHEADSCAAALREDIAARELDLARLAAEADAADATDDGTVDDEDDADEAAVIAAERAATAAEAELRRAEDRRAAAIDRLAAAAAAARARRPRANPGARRPRASPAPRTAAPARRRSAPRPLVAIDERPPWNSCGRRGISAAEERWTPEPRPPPEPALRPRGGLCGN